MPDVQRSPTRRIRTRRHPLPRMSLRVGTGPWVTRESRWTCNVTAGRRGWTPTAPTAAPGSGSPTPTTTCWPKRSPSRSPSGMRPTIHAVPRGRPRRPRNQPSPHDHAVHPALYRHGPVGPGGRVHPRLDLRPPLTTKGAASERHPILDHRHLGSGHRRCAARHVPTRPPLMTCSRCGKPCGLLCFTITAWSGDDKVGESTLCMVCGGFLSAPTFMPTLYPELGTGG